MSKSLIVLIILIIILFVGALLFGLFRDSSKKDDDGKPGDDKAKSTKGENKKPDWKDKATRYIDEWMDTKLWLSDVDCKTLSGDTIAVNPNIETIVTVKRSKGKEKSEKNNEEHGIQKVRRLKLEHSGAGVIMTWNPARDEKEDGDIPKVPPMKNIELPMEEQKTMEIIVLIPGGTLAVRSVGVTVGAALKISEHH